MGLVYDKVKEAGLIKEYAEEGSMIIADALVTPGQEKVTVKGAAMSMDEVNALALKLDVMANAYQHEGIAAAVAEAFPVIRDAVRMTKVEAKQPFRGMKAMGADLDVIWLRPEDVGGSILRTETAASQGLYGGTYAGVYTWLQSFTAGTSDDIVPEQTMKEEGACVHIGLIDTMPIFGQVCKVNRIKFTLKGVAAPDQALALHALNGSMLAFQKFEMPVLVGPEMKQKIQIDPYITGDDRPELLTVLVAKAEDLGFA